jgi:hypothetical protein
MINYNYITDRLEGNHRLYIKNGTISVSEPSKDGWLSKWIAEQQGKK